MKWTIKEASYGDIVRVKAGEFYHYGIYVSEEEIIQFGLSPFHNAGALIDIAVCTSDVDNFLLGGFMETEELDRKEKKTRRSPKETVNIARSRIGETGYDILCNNCEHFVYECAFGRRYCEQSDIFFRTNPMQLAEIYVRKYPFDTKSSVIYPAERRKEIKKCKNESVRLEKYYAWKLLEYALDNAKGIDIKKAKLYKKGNKWCSDNCFFSISHTDDLVLIAVSSKNVGADIEKLDTDRFASFDADSVLHENEKQSFESLDAEKRAEKLNRLWVIKEAAYKTDGDGAFSPDTVDTNKKPSVVRKVRSNGKEYFIGIAGVDPLKVRFDVDENIEFIGKR